MLAFPSWGNRTAKTLTLSKMYSLRALLPNVSPRLYGDSCLDSMLHKTYMHHVVMGLQQFLLMTEIGKDHHICCNDVLAFTGPCASNSTRLVSGKPTGCRTLVASSPWLFHDARPRHPSSPNSPYCDKCSLALHQFHNPPCLLH